METINLCEFNHKHVEQIKNFQKETLKHCLKIAKYTETFTVEHMVIWSYLCEQFNTTTTSYIHDTEKM